MEQKHMGSSNNSSLSRRQFLEISTFLTSALVVGWTPYWGSLPVRVKELEDFNMRRGATELIVQPILTYQISQPRKARSWRHWGGIQTQGDVDQEVSQIEKELDALCAVADFPLRTLPVVKVTTSDQISSTKARTADVILVYAAGGWTDLI